MKKQKKKSIKPSFWEKIKNIFNNSPWHSAFTYPIIYIIFIPIISVIIGSEFTFIGSNILDVIVILLFFSTIILPPTWVIAGLFISKKKTPYILSLCIGLGSLALLIYLQIAFMEGLQKL